MYTYMYHRCIYLSLMTAKIFCFHWIIKRRFLYTFLYIEVNCFYSYCNEVRTVFWTITVTICIVMLYFRMQCRKVWKCRILLIHGIAAIRSTFEVEMEHYDTDVIALATPYENAIYYSSYILICLYTYYVLLYSFIKVRRRSHNYVASFEKSF